MAIEKLVKNNADSIAQKAVYNFVEDSYNCAEGVVAAFSEAMGINPKTYTSLAMPFGGGIGSLGHMCGAISGGLMMLGILAQQKGLKKPQIRELAQKLYQGFAEEFGTVNCHTLTHHDCNDEQGAPFDIKNCAPYLEYVVYKVNELLGD